MAYSYDNVEPATSTPQSPTVPSCAPFPLGCASSSNGPGSGKEKEKAHLGFVGITTMLDTPRKAVADIVALLQIGLRGSTGTGACLIGAVLDHMSTAQLCEHVGNVSVFAHTSPKNKMAVVVWNHPL
ncbi:hypothetical protein BJY52DRAFT_1215854 [Lactarius psammicola]|nr:hypothetical protein BJY52DRAFT_1215854 [Lactarius psammicola]